MRKLIDFVLANGSALALFLITIYLAFGGYGACVHTVKYYQKIGEMSELARQNMEKIVNLNRQISNLEQYSAQIMRKNEQLMQRIAQLEQELLAGAQKIEQLEKSRPAYPADCEPIVSHMQKEINVWKEQFSLAIADRDAWKERAMNFQALYENGQEIRLYQEEQIKLLGSQIVKQEEIIKILQREANFSLIKNRVFQAGAVLIGAVLVLGLIRGASK